MTKLNHFFSISSFLLTAAIGVTLGACDPKMIGAESEGDVECTEGETKPSGDGCNTCTCSEGDWACTEVACEPDVCKPGETKQQDCNTCDCVEGGWSCTFKDCGDTSDSSSTGGTSDSSSTGGTSDSSSTGTSGEPSTTTTGVDTYEPSTTTGVDTDEPSTTTSTTGGGVCGDGLVDPGEACDDGNQVDDDACANDCGVGGGTCLPNDPFLIDGASIVGDTLKVAVNYGGGCETHVFDMCWNEIFAESFPVQTWIALSHEGNDDFCDALLMEVRDIDLSGMKAAYQAGYQTENGTIMIHLDGYGQLLEYTF